MSPEQIAGLCLVAFAACLFLPGLRDLLRDGGRG